MVTHVLDTDILSLLQLQHPKVSAAVAVRPAGDIAVSVISVEEQLTGWYTQVRRAKTPADLVKAYHRLARTVQDFSGLQILPLTMAALTKYHQLKKLKLPVGTHDLRIAAIVLEHNATLVTRNEKDFRRVPGLTIENWAK